MCGIFMSPNSVLAGRQLACGGSLGKRCPDAEHALRLPPDRLGRSARQHRQIDKVHAALISQVLLTSAEGDNGASRRGGVARKRHLHLQGCGRRTRALPPVPMQLRTCSTRAAAGDGALYGCVHSATVRCRFGAPASMMPRLRPATPLVPWRQRTQLSCPHALCAYAGFTDATESTGRYQRHIATPYILPVRARAPVLASADAAAI